MIGWIIGYFILLLIVALALSRKKSVHDYFMNDNKTGLWQLVFAHVATFIGSAATIVIVSQAYSVGISYGIGLLISFLVGFLAWSFLSVHIKDYCDRNGIFTISDFVGMKYGNKSQILTELIQISIFLIAISAQMIAMGYLTSQILNTPFLIGLILSGGITLLYTSMGGLKLDIISDNIQAIIFLFLFILMSILILFRIDMVQLTTFSSQTYNLISFGGVKWFLGMIFFGGLFLIGLNQHWMRVISAKSSKIARKSFLYAIPLIILMFLMMLFFGLSSKILLPDGTSNTILFSLMELVLPKALLGLGYVAILSVLMSSIDSFALGGSSILINRLKKRSSLKLARSVTFLFGLIGIFFAYYWQSITAIAYLAISLSIIMVPIVIAGLFFRYVSKLAVLTSLIVSSIITIVAYPLFGNQTFIASFLTSLIITFGYDKLFTRK